MVGLDSDPLLRHPAVSRLIRADRSSDRAAAPDRRRARCSRSSPRPFPRSQFPRNPRPARWRDEPGRRCAI